jgi:hypothetical protein
MMRAQVLMLAVAALIGAAILVGCGETSDAEWRENCQYLREHGAGGGFACGDLEEREFEEGWEEAEAQEEAERESSPSGKSKWEELGR